MTVGFYHAGPPSPHAALMVASVRRTMPNVDVVQFSPAGTTLVPGVSALRPTQDQPLIARAVLHAYATVSGEWLFLDTDVLVQRDVRDVWATAFDIAVATREGTFKDEAEARSGCMTSMPFNKGVVFSRSSIFWADALVRICDYSEKRQHWMGDQQAVCDAIASGHYAVAHLPNTYNYPPKTRHEDVSEKAILHFKGPRKAWMAGRAA